MAYSGENNKAQKVGNSILFRLTVAAIIAPALIVLVVGVATGLRLRAEAHSVSLSHVGLSSFQIASKLRDVPSELIGLEIGKLETNLRIRLGVYWIDSDSASPFEIDGLSADDVPGLLSEEPAILDVAGVTYAVAASKIKAGSDTVYLVVLSLPPSFKRAGLPGMLRFSAVALLVLLGAALFGAAKGFEYSDYFCVLTTRMSALLGIAKSRRDGPISSAPRSQEASNDFELAFSLVEEGFVGELAMYRDAVEEVQTLDAQRTAFLGDLSSDLHEPLVRVLDHTQRLMDGEDGPLKEAQADDVRIVATAGKRLMRIVEDVLDLSSLVHDGLVYDDEFVDLTEIAREVIETAKGGLGKKTLNLCINCDKGVTPLVRGSRQRLWQVLTNLVSNAVKFSEAGTVAVWLGCNEEGRVFVEVSDMGAGIPDDYQEDIFDPFKQRGELSKKLRGTGLGLAISKRLVELHEGEIRVTSKEGEGSRFTVILPSAK